MIEFPKDFLWGSAISSHQVEGNNINNDWWQDEAAGVFHFRSGNACRHYELFRQDFDLARELGHNALRISIEWSRIQPQAGNFNEAEIQHYKEVVRALRERGLEPIVTLHHFTNPAWFNQAGGWLNEDKNRYFSSYVKEIVGRLSEDVTYWVTINEPMVYLYYGFLLGSWPPHEKGLLKFRKAEKQLINAHIESYRIIHDIYRKRGLHPPFVSVAKNMRYFFARKSNFCSRLAVFLRNRYFNLRFLESVHKKGALDLIGVNYYTRENVYASGLSLSNIFFQTLDEPCEGIRKNSLGWDIFPEGLYKVLLTLKKFDLPVIILENGVCTDDDTLRRDFISGHLRYLHKAMQEGITALGYLYWSLLDNFEWDKGFAPRFGIIDVDYATYKRTPRESAREYARICRSSRIAE